MAGLRRAGPRREGTALPTILPPPRRTFRPEPAPDRKRWTRRDCEFLVQSGLLTGRYELIDGEIISKMGQKPPHSYVIMRLNGWLVATFGADFVRMQLPIDVAEEDGETNEPEPDAVVLSRPGIEFLERQPGPDDVLLAVEVSDTTLRFDRRTKAALYARAGIGEYWVVDVAGRRVYVHRQPGRSGYGEVTAYGADEVLAPLCRPEAVLRPSDLLPPA